MMSPMTSDPEDAELQRWLNAPTFGDGDDGEEQPAAPKRPAPRVEIAPVAPVAPPAAAAPAAPVAGPPSTPAWKRGLQIGVEGLDALVSGIGGKEYNSGYYRNLENRRTEQQRYDQQQAQQQSARTAAAKTAEQKAEEAAALKRERSDPNSATNKRLQANVAKALQADPQAFAGMTVDDYAAYGGDVVKAQLAAKQRERDEKQRAEAAARQHAFDLERDQKRPYHPPPRPAQPTGDDFGGLEGL